MNSGYMEWTRKDEWSELLLLMMKTSLSVAHELRLPPDATLDCAARYLRFHDFAWFASAMHGASRAQSCCEQSCNFSSIEAAYIRKLAGRLKNNRNAFACAPTTPVSEIQDHDESPAQAYEKVAAAIKALKGDIRREFARSDVSYDTAVDNISGLAQALVTLVPADSDVEPYERVFAALLHVRFSVNRYMVLGRHSDAGHDRANDADTPNALFSPAQNGWMHRIKHTTRHPNGVRE
jgi:hypothetical protein